jgi:Flp pilus assembly protein TadG
MRRYRLRGALSVEVALTLPVLMLMLFGSYEVARANMLHHAAENAAYEAARAGIIPGATPTRCRDQAAFALRSMGVRNFSVKVVPSSLDRRTPTVGIEVRVPLRGNTLMAPLFFRNTNFRGFCELKREVL